MKAFDLELAIKTWKRSLLNAKLDEGTRQELENHLRDSIEDLITQGYSEEAAFTKAVNRLGTPKGIGQENIKARARGNTLMGSMVIQTFLIQWRLLKRRSIYALINVMGLVLGFACCLLITLFIRDELSYDSFHSKSDRIFRVATDANLSGTDRSWALVPSLMMPPLYEDLPEVEGYTMLAPANQSQHTIKYKDQLFDESGSLSGKVIQVDTSFFNVFDFEFIVGDRKTAIAPDMVVITASRAMKLFGRTDVLGEMIEVMNVGKLGISGVIKDPPRNSHLQFGYLLHSDFKASGFVPFIWVRAYLVLNTPESALKVGENLKPILDKATAETMNAVEMWPFLQELKEVHLTSHLEYEIGSNGDRKNIVTFGLIAIVILLIAAINFTNLATAKSAIRAREVGVRKVLGARKRQLISQFLSESITMSVIALVLSFGLVLIALPVFNQLTGKVFLSSELLDTSLLIASLSLALSVGIVAGIYPAFFMSSFRPIVVLKGKLTLGRGKGAFRKVLVVLQFSISVIMIFSTLVVLQQTNFMKNQGLGFEKDQIIILPIDRAWTREAQLLKQEVLVINGVVSASLSSHIPSMRGGVMVMQPEGFSDKETQMLDGIYADFDFIKTYGLDIAIGRDFNSELITDSLNFIVNETAIDKFGWEMSEASIGKKIKYPNGPVSGTEGTVIGISRDAHFRSLHHAISPMMFGISNSKFPFLGTNYLSLRVKSEDVTRLMETIEQIWNSLSLDKAYSYSFLNQQFNTQYQSEEKLSELFIYFSFLAIFIACLGLFALAAFTTEQKTKEIGIRKTLGATVSQLSGKITWGFTRWVVVANVIAWPVAAIVMNQWLQGFAYRMSIGFSIFAFSTIISMLIALTTVSYMSVKAARANPIKALRYE